MDGLDYKRIELLSRSLKRFAFNNKDVSNQSPQLLKEIIYTRVFQIENNQLLYDHQMNQAIHEISKKLNIKLEVAELIIIIQNEFLKSGNFYQLNRKGMASINSFIDLILYRIDREYHIDKKSGSSGSSSSECGWEYQLNTNIIQEDQDFKKQKKKIKKNHYETTLKRKPEFLEDNVQKKLKSTEPSKYRNSTEYLNDIFPNLSLSYTLDKHFENKKMKPLVRAQTENYYGYLKKQKPLNDLEFDLLKKL